MAMSSRNYEVVVWGATGFVGKLVCEYLVKDYRGKVRWAMAARNQQKLATVRQELCKIHPSAQDIPMLTGSLEDKQSLKAIAAQTRVVLTTAGPYSKLGSPVVEACISETTHYCDLTGEYIWVKKIMQTHQDEAARKGVKIVNCCGFDSIPSDLGAQMMVNHIKDKLGRPTKSVTALVKAMGGTSGGTLGSLLLLLEAPADETKAALDPYYLNPPGSNRGPDKGDSVMPHWNPVAGRYAAPWVMAPTNTRIVRKSNAMLGDKYGEGGFSYTESLSIPYGVVAYALTAVFGLAIAALQSAWVRSQIKSRLPSEVPRETCENGYCGDGNAQASAAAAGTRVDHVIDNSGSDRSIDMYAESDEGQGKPSQVVHGFLKGLQDPGYLDTSKMIVEAAICLAQQGDECESAGYLKGGILTPASAMGMILMKRLQHKGFTFNILDDLKPRT